MPKKAKRWPIRSIPSSGGGDAHSAEAVRFRIKQLIDQESPESVLSDDAIVLRLKEANVDIARRTVAKYRESLRDVHPDHGGDASEAGQRIEQLGEARRVLLASLA